MKRNCLSIKMACLGIAIKFTLLSFSCASIYSGNDVSSEDDVLFSSSEISIGSTINMLSNYGLMMKIFPQYMKSCRAFLNEEFKRNLLNQSTIQNYIRRNTTGKSDKNPVPTIKICDSWICIIDHILSSYQIDGVDDKQNSFLSLYHLNHLLHFLGLNSDLNFDPSYIFVQYNMCKTDFELASPITNSMLDSDFKKAVQNINSEDYTTIDNFVRSKNGYGSHYVSSFSTGTNIYQIFTFRKKYFNCISNNINGVFNLHNLEKRCTNRSGTIKAGRIIMSSPTQYSNELTNEDDPTYTIFDAVASPSFAMSEVCDKDTQIVTDFKLNFISDVIKDKKKSFSVLEMISNNILLTELNL